MNTFSVDHIMVTVQDLDESSTWYCTHFGFQEVTRYQKQDIGASIALLDGENIKLELFTFTQHSDTNNNKDLNVIGLRHIAFSVSNLESVMESLSRLHFSPTTKGASGYRYCFTEDPNGVQIELYENNI